MSFQLPIRRAFVLFAVMLLCAIYLANLTGMGLVSTDEPRYADIGRGMANSGDWVTPRLWGKPWFEKPALLYWTIAIGFKLRLGPELSPRLPVALLSLSFLAFFWMRVRELWNPLVATHATAVLATSAGWLAFSHIAVTDLPLAVFFSIAVLLTLESESSPATTWHLSFAAAALGLAVLAKSLVPLVLFAPVVVLNYEAIKRNVWAILIFAGVALPWYILCGIRNGGEFLRVLFVEQQFGRFFTPERQHVQPWWFYFPALLLLLYPWFPLLAVLPRNFHDRRTRTLAAVVVFGFVFFSASTNKLNGYLLPLMPSLCILIGIGLAESKRPERAIVLPVALLGALPVAARVLPEALADGLHSADIPYTALAIWMGVAGIAALILTRFLHSRAFVTAAIIVSTAFLWFQFAVFPSIDVAATARTRWRVTHPSCIDARERGIMYGMYYYAGRELPPCDVP